MTRTSLPARASMSPRRHARRSACRRGAATVEMALCLPILLTVSLGMIEVCNIVQVRTRMITAAYESTRLATRPQTAQKRAATNGEVTAYCNSLLTQFGIHGANVTLSPASLSGLPPETPVTVTVAAPLSQNAVSSYVIQSAPTITVRTTLVVE